MLFCPEDNKSFMPLQANFWLDEDDDWHVDCPICHAEHPVKGLRIRRAVSKSPKKSPKKSGIVGSAIARRNIVRDNDPNRHGIFGDIPF
jgi:hypothetical protein